jgi:DeoR/GlpR family transcriptional regulator of sugar metabolism
MLSEQRHSTILSLLDDNGLITVGELVDRFEVSEMTVRRDLDALERQGLLRRIHGGAVSARGRSYEPAFLTRKSAYLEAKQRIGQAAASLVKDGDSLTLDVGTTTVEVARHLTERRNLTILTPSLHIAYLLSEQPGIRLILTGGILRAGELSLVGALAERTFGEFFVDRLFLGVGGVDLSAGLTEFNSEDAHIKQAMLASAKEVIVVCDSSKLGEIALNAVAPLSKVHTLITDTDAAPDFVAALEKMSIQVLLA